MLAPFNVDGVQADSQEVKHYSGLPTSVVAMLRASADRDPDA